MAKRRHKRFTLRPFAGFKKNEQKKLDGGSNDLWVSPAHGEYTVNGSICTLECKVLFILQEIAPVSKGNTAPSCFLLLLSSLPDSFLHVFTFV